VAEDTPLQAAQKGMVSVAMSFPMDGRALVTAFVNSLMQSARVDALFDFVVQEYDGDQTPKERLDALLVTALNAKAAKLKETLAQPRIELASGLNGHG
jgi:hypothetical protein